MQPAAPLALYVPAGQTRHDAELVELVFGLYVPALQRVQMPAVASLYEPGAHAVIPLEPLGQYVPAVHGITGGAGDVVPV